jgi:hypothetical protein
MTEHALEDVKDELKRVHSVVDSIGHQPISLESQPMDDSGTEVLYLKAQQGDIRYTVQSSPVWRQGFIVSQFNAVNALANGRLQQRNDSQSANTTPSEAELSQARSDLRDNADDLGTLRADLVESLSRGPLTLSVFADDDNLVEGFKVERPVFLYDQNIPVQTFNDMIQSVVSASLRGKVLLEERYDIKSALGKTATPGPRGFQ